MIGYRTNAAKASGQQSTSKMHQKTNVNKGSTLLGRVRGLMKDGSVRGIGRPDFIVQSR